MLEESLGRKGGIEFPYFRVLFFFFSKKRDPVRFLNQGHREKGKYDQKKNRAPVHKKEEGEEKAAIREIGGKKGEALKTEKGKTGRENPVEQRKRNPLPKGKKLGRDVVEKRGGSRGGGEKK